MLATLILATLLAFPPPEGNKTPPIDPKKQAALAALKEASKELLLSPQEREALAALKKVGLGPHDLRFLVGTGIRLRYHPFDPVTMRPRSRPLTAKDLAPLAALGRTREIFLEEAPINDETLMALGGLAQLEKLYLKGTRITDAGLKYLRDLKKLRQLNLE